MIVADLCGLLPLADPKSPYVLSLGPSPPGHLWTNPKANYKDFKEPIADANRGESSSELAENGWKMVVQLCKPTSSL